MWPYLVLFTLGGVGQVVADTASALTCAFPDLGDYPGMSLRGQCFAERNSSSRDEGLKSRSGAQIACGLLAELFAGQVLMPRDAQYEKHVILNWYRPPTPTIPFL